MKPNLKFSFQSSTVERCGSMMEYQWLTEPRNEPGKLKSRVLMTPLALSPPRSTPEPDLSSIPQDAATVPSLAASQALTVCLYINKQANAGPYLERRKVQQLPEHFGPERPSAVLQQAVQACIDCAHQQKLVFSLAKGRQLSSHRAV
ncbi:SCML4 [Cervus elaphus hippelaphus]|uniref:SCML4 n=1 Tax=Cervus elaphus hippelaphus TaxID=46360 RepID=A0A212C5Z9_CEREH|nr:SCML4 [Cervus elaphus hippelaphus]